MAENTALHIIDRSIRDPSRLNHVLNRSGPKSAILFIQDSVYALTASNTAAKSVARCMKTNTVYALSADLKARGIGADEIVSGIILIDYPEFVDLTLACPKINRWL